MQNGVYLSSLQHFLCMPLHLHIGNLNRKYKSRCGFQLQCIVVYPAVLIFSKCTEFKANQISYFNSLFTVYTLIYRQSSWDYLNTIGHLKSQWFMMKNK